MEPTYTPPASALSTIWRCADRRRRPSGRAGAAARRASAEGGCFPARPLELGARRGEHVIYVGERWPAAWSTTASCWFCFRPLVSDPSPDGSGEMLTCYGGCGQRYWIDTP